MCERCDGFNKTIKIEHIYEYFHMVEQIKVIINEGIMYIYDGNCDFDGAVAQAVENRWWTAPFVSRFIEILTILLKPIQSTSLKDVLK